ncbi:MAG: hypothetical protein ACLRTQ_00345 [Candidatus Borkfalkia sp.]
MKRFLSCFVLSVTLLLFAAAAVRSTTVETATNRTAATGQTEVTLRFNADSGWVIHKPTPTNINGVYRYGPAFC